MIKELRVCINFVNKIVYHTYFFMFYGLKHVKGSGRYSSPEELVPVPDNVLAEGVASQLYSVLHHENLVFMASY